jgi:MFS family permease
MQVKLGRRIFYGWIVVGIAFLIMSAAYAIWFSFPLFYVAILDEFGWSRAETALIFSIGAITYGVGSAIGGALLDRFGPRKTFTFGAIVMAIGVVGCSQSREIWQFFFFWGALTAFGVSTVGFTPCNTLVSRWFIKRRATAVGIAQAGGRESFIMTPLVQFLILSLGWQNTFLVLAAAAALIIISATQFLRSSPEDMGLLPDGAIEELDEKGEVIQKPQDRSVIDKEWAATDWTLKLGMKHYRFWSLFVASFAIGSGFSIAMIHQVAFIVDIGFTAMFASFLLLLFGILSVAGRLSAFIADITGREVAYTLGCGGIVLGFLMLTLSNSDNAWALYVYAIFFGFFSGLNGPVVIAAGADLFQGKHMGAILGFINLGYGLGNSFGSWFGGYIFDTVGNYIPAFVVAILMMIVATTAMWIASPRKVRAVGRRALEMRQA